MNSLAHILYILRHLQPKQPVHKIITQAMKSLKRYPVRLDRMFSLIRRAEFGSGVFSFSDADRLDKLWALAVPPHPGIVVRSASVFVAVGS